MVQFKPEISLKISSLREQVRIRLSRIWSYKRIWAFFLGLCWVLWLHPQGVWSQTASLRVSVQGQDYAQMVEASRPQVWQALGERFAQSSDPVEQVSVEVMGQQGSTQVPLLLVTMTRADWQTGPSPQQMEQYAQFYTSAIQLLTPPSPAPVEFTPPQTPQSVGDLRLIQSQPSDQAIGVPVTQALTFDFDQALDPDLETLQVSIFPPLEMGFDVQDSQLLIQPLQLLKYSTSYQISLGAVGDQSVGEPIQLTFRTEPQYTYRRDVEPLLRASCVGCHQTLGRQNRQLLDSYEAVMKYVIPQSPDSPLIDPRWTRRHARPQRASQPQPGESPQPTDLENLPGVELENGIGIPASPPLTLTQVEDQPFTLPTTRGGRSPELAYVRRQGISEDRLGAWTPAEVDIVKTWIVQDGAPESIADAVMD